MPNDAQIFNYAKAYLRRTKTVDQLKALAETVAAAILHGEDHVVITSTGHDGSSGSGELRVAADVVGLAVEQLLAELAPEDSLNPSAASHSGAYADFSHNPITV